MSTKTDQKREMILDAAAQLFMERGYAATSVRELSLAAGVSQGTLYYYIHSKPDALYALYESFVDDYLPAIRAIIHSELRPQEKLCAFVRTTMGNIERNCTRMSVFFRERSSLDPDHLTRVEADDEEVESTLGMILQEGIDKGEFRIVPLRSTEMVIFGMFRQTIEQSVRNPGKVDVPRLTDEYIDLIQHALCPAAS